MKEIIFNFRRALELSKLFYNAGIESVESEGEKVLDGLMMITESSKISDELVRKIECQTIIEGL